MPSSLLLSLPDEVLLQIVSHLTPPLDGLDIPFQAYTDPDGVVVTNRVALYRLAFVCRRLSDLAIPHLYQTVYLWGQTRLQSLLQTLLERPELGDNMRVLSYVSCLGTDHYPTDVLCPYKRTEWRRLVDASSRFPDRIKNFVREANTELEFAQIVFALVLYSSPNLSTLHMRMPFAAGEYQKLKDIITPDIETAEGCPRVLSSLTRVMLEPMPDFPGASFWPRRELPCLLRLPKLRSVELGSAVFRPAVLDPGDGWGDDGSWKNVEEIRLVRSSMWGQGWHAICALCPNLKLLEMGPSGVAEQPADGEHNLNTALSLVADTLETFSFEGILAGNFSQHVGGDGTLTCLPKMKALRNVKLDIGILYGNPEGVQSIDLRDRLPPSVEILDLAELWHDVEVDQLSTKERCMYEKGLQDALHKLVFDSREALPHLKEITFRPNPFYDPLPIPDTLKYYPSKVAFKLVY
ncbi:hypothetical protein CGRA01v4_13993 [Colletotrichum graminicola]|uniref:F-box domain-containing protein n=1 Tax=Colletotrichum graminicola (strain M1.001 / M2 / FGSC 10212) TaxID=645133 RepID=E3QYD2_COLGM|nr:uncharacterized protein GLRG_11061 [Colletotrichum graminicola M1.001]EFQ35870.1 hypothetical protein GLRG_11061 [Colletotrichum graminicola M1.001]WDK22703.1 hypothetical protein CGRA01v4_13993 [Colletotrichum graminicola]